MPSHDLRRVALCLLPILASCWLHGGSRRRLTPRYGLRDKIKENWRSGWGSDGDTDDAGVDTFEGAYDADADANTDEAVPIYDDEAADRAVALFASALDDDELDRLQVRDLDDEPKRIIGLDGKPLDDEPPARVIGLDGKPLDDALEALNAGPADDQEPEDARSADAEAALDLLTYDEMDRQEEADVDERLGVVMSHELIEVDDDGDNALRRPHPAERHASGQGGAGLCGGHGRARIPRPL